MIFSAQKILRYGLVYVCFCRVLCRADISPSVPSPAFAEALEQYRSNNFSAARARFAAIALVKPNDPDVGFYLGRIAWWFDDNEESVRLLERAAAEAPGNGEIQNALGDAYGCMALDAGLFAKVGWAKKCLAAHQSAVQLSPGDLSCRWGLFGYYCLAPRFAGGGYDKAYLEAQTIQKMNQVDGRIALETLYLSEGKNSLAFAQFGEVLGSEPDDYLALYHLGRCAALSGEQLARGAAALRRCLQLPAPRGLTMPTEACVHFRLANILEKQGNKIAAEAEQSAAMRSEPDFRSDKIALRN